MRCIGRRRRAGERMTERKMKDGFWMPLCAACLAVGAVVQARELTALDIFAQLPITLFEKQRRKAFLKMKSSG